jgi:hypothetical protein
MHTSSQRHVHRWEKRRAVFFAMFGQMIFWRMR